MIISDMETLGDIREAKDILQNLMKAKKTIRMYPANNPVYIKTLEEAYERFTVFFDYKDELTLKINRTAFIMVRTNLS
jgi:hypothetical protein